MKGELILFAKGDQPITSIKGKWLVIVFNSFLLKLFFHLSLLKVLPMHIKQKMKKKLSFFSSSVNRTASPRYRNIVFKHHAMVMKPNNILATMLFPFRFFVSSQGGVIVKFTHKPSVGHTGRS